MLTTIQRVSQCTRCIDQIGLTMITIKSLALRDRFTLLETVKLAKTVKVEHYNEPMFYIVSPVEYKRIVNKRARLNKKEG